MRFILLILVALVAGCSSSGKKEYPPLDTVENKIEITPVWVKNVGKKSFIESRQFGISTDDARVFLSDAGGNIMALNQENGAILWKKSMGDLVLNGPIADGETLYVSTNEAQFFALRASDGEVLWQSGLSSEMLADPVMNDKYIYLQTIDGKLYALNRKNGEKVWVDSREVPPLTLRGTSSPLLLKSMVIAGFANGKLTALDPETGSHLWETAISIASGRTDLQRMVDIDGSIQADSDQVYAVTYQGRIAALSQQDGRTNWSREMSAFRGVKIDGQQLYVVDASDQVWALDRKTGATIWRQDKLEGRDLTGVVLVNNAIVVADGAGYLHWLSREDGSFVAREYLKDTYEWGYHDFGDDDRNEFDFGVSSELKVANNRLFVRNNMGALSVFQLSAVQNN